MKNLNRYFDSTILKPEAGPEQIITLCREAFHNKFFAVCVNPCYVKLAKETLESLACSDLRTTAVATVVGFPLGANTTESKIFETKNALDNGADEIDMVINIGMLKAGENEYVLRDISEVVNETSARGKTVKVILETCLLADDEIVSGCLLSKRAGAAFVKTSTGFNSGGATVHAVKLMKKTVGNSMKIKASGGIRDLNTALEMISAGADRLGCSSCLQIMNQLSQ
ncbi:MAG: deoxyribose-phosphate aldolase [Hornefia sp.]|nr:deoxyribose-phosphate aldolase [Hornefia sp.]